MNEEQNMPINNDEKDSAIGPGTPVRIGFVVGLIGSYTLAIWWAAGVSSTLAAVDSRLKSIENSSQSRSVTIDQLDTRLKMIEQFGSPAMQQRIREVERSLDSMKKSSP